MIQEITLTKRVQTPTPPNEWLYQDQGENFRYFTKKVLLGAEAEPWAECTDAEKTAYEAQWAIDHPEESVTLDTETEDDWVNDTGDPATDPILSPSTVEEGAGV